MRDKFCSDIENHSEMLKSVKEQEKKIAENSQALKGITTESMGKLKEMVNNCMQLLIMFEKMKYKILKKGQDSTNFF